MLCFHSFRDCQTIWSECFFFLEKIWLLRKNMKTCFVFFQDVGCVWRTEKTLAILFVAAEVLFFFQDIHIISNSAEKWCFCRIENISN